MTTTRLKNGRSTATRHQKNDKVQDALQLLNQAARDKQDELYEALEGKYKEIKQTIAEAADAGRDVLDEARKKAESVVDSGQALLKSKANEIDQKLHENPWVFIGGVALTSFLIGYTFRKKIS